MNFLSFAKNMRESISKNVSKNLNSKYSQNFLDHGKQSTTDALKTAPKREIQKTAESTDDLIYNKIANKQYSSPQNRSETVTNEVGNIEFDREIPEERYISPEKR